MHCFSNKFSKIAKRWELSVSNAPFTFNIGDLKLRDLAKLWIFKQIMKKLNFKKYVMTSFSDVIIITSPKKCHQNNVTQFFQFAPFQSKCLATPVVL